MDFWVFGFLGFWIFGILMFLFFVFYTCVSNLWKQLQSWIRKNGVCIGIYIFKGCACRRESDHIHIYIYICIYIYISLSLSLSVSARDPKQRGP